MATCASKPSSLRCASALALAVPASELLLACLSVRTGVDDPRHCRNEESSKTTCRADRQYVCLEYNPLEHLRVHPRGLHSGQARILGAMLSACKLSQPGNQILGVCRASVWKYVCKRGPSEQLHCSQAEKICKKLCVLEGSLTKKSKCFTGC